MLPSMPYGSTQFNSILLHMQADEKGEQSQALLGL